MKKFFRERADQCNIIIDDREPQVLQRAEVLGIEVDLETARFRWLRGGRRRPRR